MHSDPKVLILRFLLKTPESHQSECCHCKMAEVITQLCMLVQGPHSIFVGHYAWSFDNKIGNYLSIVLKKTYETLNLYYKTSILEPDWTILTLIILFKFMWKHLLYTFRTCQMKFSVSRWRWESLPRFVHRQAGFQPSSRWGALLACDHDYVTWALNDLFQIFATPS